MRIEIIPVQLRMLDNEHPRTPGLHQGKILRKMAAERGYLKEVDASDLSMVEVNESGFWESLDPESQIRMAVGMAWEEWYSRQLDDVSFHPGELVVDGVYMTPDGESLEFVHGSGYVPAVHEIKATSKSTNTVSGLNGDKNWLWRAQMLGYCKAMNTNIAYLHVLFLYGDYERPFKMQVRCWRFEFTWTEIEMNWKGLLGFIKHHQRLAQHEDY